MEAATGRLRLAEVVALFRVYDPVLVAVPLPIVADALTQVDKLDPRDAVLAAEPESAPGRRRRGPPG